MVFVRAVTGCMYCVAEPPATAGVSGRVVGGRPTLDRGFFVQKLRTGTKYISSERACDRIQRIQE